MLWDTHCHLNFKAFANSYGEVAQRALQEKIGMIIVGTKYRTSYRAAEIASQFKDQPVYAAIGLHPIHLMDNMVSEEEDTFKAGNESFEIDEYKKLISKFKSKIIAIGETGFDYYWLKGLSANEQIEQKKKQWEIFVKHYQLAKEFDLPLIIHCREAHPEMIDVLSQLIKEESFKKNRGVIHCFSGSLKEAEKYLNLGFYLGLNGIITYGKNLDEVIKIIPKDKIVVETDSPYLTPNPLGKRQRNEPLFVKKVVEKIADLWGVVPEAAADILGENAENLFSV